MSPGRLPQGMPATESGHDAANPSGWADEVARRAPTTQRPQQAWQNRALLLMGLAGAVMIVLWLRTLAGQPAIDANFRLLPDGRPALLATSNPALRPLVGQVLHSLEMADGRTVAVDASMLSRSPRWVVDDDERARQQAWRDQLAEALDQPALTLVFDNGQRVDVAPQPRGLAGLGLSSWLFCGLALALYGATVVVMLDARLAASRAYAVLAGAQVLNLLIISADSLIGLGVPPLFGQQDLAWRVLADAVLAAGLVHQLALYPQRLPRAGWITLAAWLVLVGGALLLLAWQPDGLWWWVQGLMVAACLAGLALLRLARQRQPSPLVDMLVRLLLAGLATLVLLSATIALADRAGLSQLGVASIGSSVWHVFIASLLMLAPFLSRSRQVVREFATLAGISTVVSSLDLLFVTLGVGPLGAVALALAAAGVLYVGARRWILRRMGGSGVLSAERMFESLYRAARAVEQTPERAGDQLGTLLREVFDPLELSRSQRQTSRIRAAVDGSTLVVPVPQLAGADDRVATIVLRYAHRGRHLFTNEDVRLTGRLIEQLRSAVAYDRAVEHGRSEERTRIAQDLHDDIGARLLTLMYKAQDPEIEEYIRHTLQDLKTLTRGLAAANHRLSHAAAEWKADIAQRLAATGCDLRWSFSSDRDINLTVVQWSGLTRVLRELVNNIIAHAQATQVEVVLQFEGGRISLQVSDDGQGRAPERWSHGLGLGGVRKRVKLLGGQVAWQERPGRGIRCEVQALLVNETA